MQKSKKRRRSDDEEDDGKSENGAEDDAPVKLSDFLRAGHVRDCVLTHHAHIAHVSKKYSQCSDLIHFVKGRLKVGLKDCRNSSSFHRGRGKYFNIFSPLIVDSKFQIGAFHRCHKMTH